MSLYRRWPLSEITGFVRRQAVGVGAQARAAERAYQQVGAKNSYLAATPCSLVDEDRSAPLLSAFNDAMLTHHSVARPIAERALQLDPGCPSAVAPLAYMLIASGCRHHRVKAGELLSHCAARSRKRARPWTRREQHLHHGLLLAADLRPGAAVEAFSASLAQDPFDPLLVRMVCDLAYWRGDMERGWEVVHAATESAQSRADALTEHSRALLLGYSAFFTDQCGDGAAALALAEESESATAASYSQPAVAAPRSWGNPWALHAKIHALEGMEDAEGVLAALGAFAVDHGGHSSFLRTHMAFHAGMAVLHASAPAPAASEQAAVLGVFDAAWASANREYGHDLANCAALLWHAEREGGGSIDVGGRWHELGLAARDIAAASELPFIDFHVVLALASAAAGSGGAGAADGLSEAAETLARQLEERSHGRREPAAPVETAARGKGPPASVPQPTGEQPGSGGDDADAAAAEDDDASGAGDAHGWHADAAEQALLFSRVALSLRGGDLRQARRFSWQACQGAPTAAEAARTLGGSETQRAIFDSLVEACDPQPRAP